MPSNSIKNRCHINTNYDTDTFVGIKCEKGEFTISFPLGFSLSDDEKSLRKEILLMLNTISAATKQMESKVQRSSVLYPEEGFPFQAYMYILSDYFSRGLYREREQHFQISRKGKIDWNRTIKTQKPFVQGTNAFYLDFVTRKSSAKENELITLIHEYCVYDSMRKIGWLFTSAEPAKPRIKLNAKLFKTVVNDKLRSTFNDRNRVLFANMLAVIEHLQDEDSPTDYKCGTNRFEYVWEAMIDKVFGIEGKEKYFPKTTWNLNAGSYNNASLEPDTIMVYGGNIYVLDAKYYKFGATKHPWDLPESTSINKQITYGEFIAEEEKFKKLHGKNFKTYNAFLMPFSMSQWTSTSPIFTIGNATSDWKSSKKEYETIVGILIDVKHLMQISVHENEEEMRMLAETIEKSFGA
ncbi:LlaJI family restriction endonuclease [Faecalicatena contorta]|uniref:LlaJI family restriction endonuclease n=1 Tax=Faecalicatena contorta TaxID=39482 RepID=UPI001F1E9402|nr:LlaJI family restriction endonuclease [Faecalicatena contorta]MCF2554988.1 LlaJI family restriction endonuclease [Faecalicatena contorta]